MCNSQIGVNKECVKQSHWCERGTSNSNNDVNKERVYHCQIGVMRVVYSSGSMASHITYDLTYFIPNQHHMHEDELCVQ